MLDFLPSGQSNVNLTHEFLSSGASVSVAIPDHAAGIGLVLIPDIFGLRPLVDETITQLGSLGISVIAVEPFSYVAEIPSELSREEKFDLVKTMDDNIQCADYLAAGQLLRMQHACSRVYLIGFCIGGMYAFKCAGTGAFECVISCYGMISLPDNWKGLGQREPMEYLEMQTSSKVIAIVGGQDKGYANSDDVDLLRKIIENPHHIQLGSEMILFPEAKHAFMHDPLREEHRPADANKAFSRVLSEILE